MPNARLQRAQRRTEPPGFTLIELMIVVALIAIIASIAIPNLLAARLSANESAAASMLRTISTAQTQFQLSGKADEDLDGVGEYGYFAELGARIGPRGGTVRLPAELTSSLAVVSSNGEITRSGYHLRMYLPAAGGVGTKEAGGGGIGAFVLDADLAESIWACYAWPANYGNTGARTFFINNTSNILAADDARYSGPNDADLVAGAAMLGGATTITGRLAVGTTGADGGFWKQLQ